MVSDDNNDHLKSFNALIFLVLTQKNGKKKKLLQLQLSVFNKYNFVKNKFLNFDKSTK